MDIPDVDKMVGDIAHDNISGASALARNAAECLDKFASRIMNEHADLEPKSFLDELTKLAKRLVLTQPDMAPMFIFVNRILVSIKDEYSQIPEQMINDRKKQLKYLCTLTQSYARKIILESKLALEGIAQSYKEIIEPDDTIMTISASSAIEMLLNNANKNDLKFTVFVPESRPMYEGRQMAERLAENGIKTILIADAAMFNFLSDCSKILVGADKVVPSGIINKIGTYGLGIAGKEFSVPFFCACESTKFIPDIIGTIDQQNLHHEEQLFPTKTKVVKPPELNVKNIYFDFTPMELVTMCLTENGLLTADQISEFIKNINLESELVTAITNK
jgi:translation initiation factor 2B subunit (eIF-2B alpha/beta/delta family)